MEAQAEHASPLTLFRNKAKALLSFINASCSRDSYCWSFINASRA